MARIVVGLSGGVDSSVAAYLLKQQGHEVIGLFMRNWHDAGPTLESECPWIEDSNDAMMVAEKLGIPFQTVDFSAEYKKRIVDYMFSEYAQGRTPNPDVLCNREIKFDSFLDMALRLGADFVATGHYCQKSSAETNGKTVYKLLAGADPNKDQSYFLCQISQWQLAKALFPIGHLLKPQVRELAREAGLVTAGKKDSQGLCFIGKVRLPDFLKQQLQPKEGDILEVPPTAPPFANGHTNGSLAQIAAPYRYQAAYGEAVGRHQGAHYFTIGQRKGLHVGGKQEPLFVLGTDIAQNIVYVGQGEQHPGLYRQGLFVSMDETSWLREDLRPAAGQAMRVLGRIRYRQPLEPLTLHAVPEGYYLVFDRPQKSIAAGQFAAWYSGNELIGSGTIAA